MSGKLYVVGTPIGNLGDFSPRALETLQSVDVIACEDTRVTLKLMNRFEIKKPQVSYYEHNAREKGMFIVEELLAGKNYAVVTDAGMPCISDPGEDLVRLCAEHGIPVEVVPGPSAVISALAVSGLVTSRFSFEGFLSTTKKSRFEHLHSLKSYPNTMIFYEAPHKLCATLKDMLDVFGDRKISLARELTKIHEEVVRTTLSEAVARYEQTPPKGEFVLVLEGAPLKTEDAMSFEDAVVLMQTLIDGGTPPAQAAKEAAHASGFKKNELYREIVK